MQLLLLPLIAAFIGWMTNYLAVKMLFHPRDPKRILGCTIQGVFPKRQNVLAKKLGALVAQELFSAEDVTQHLAEATKSGRIRELIDKQLDTFINETLIEKLPMLAMVLTPELAATIKNALLDSFQPMVGKLVGELGQSVKDDLDVEAIVEAKVTAFSSDRLEEILQGIMKREFRFIEFVGGLLGFLIGCLQIALIKVGVVG